MKNLYINISAKTLEEAETMLKILDKWLTFHFNCYGAKRETSFSRRANGRGQIRVIVRESEFKYIKNGLISELVSRTGKSIVYDEIIKGYAELSTEEVAI